MTIAVKPEGNVIQSLEENIGEMEGLWFRMSWTGTLTQFEVDVFG